MRVVREEMAVTLTDIVFRRTALGAELGWNSLRHEAEIDAVFREAGVAGSALGAVG